MGEGIVVVLFIILAIVAIVLCIRAGLRFNKKESIRKAKEQVEYYDNLSKKEATHRKETLKNTVRLLNAELHPTIIRLKVSLRNGVAVYKEFLDSVESPTYSPYILRAKQKADMFIKTITDDDGHIEKGDTIYPSHMIESIQRME